MQIAISSGFFDDPRGRQVIFDVIVSFVYDGTTWFVFKSPDDPDVAWGNQPGLHIISMGSTFFNTIVH